MFPINITLELENEADLQNLFFDLKKKLEIYTKELNQFLIEKGARRSHFSSIERDNLKLYVEKILSSGAKILDYSEKIEELMNKHSDANYIADSIEEFNSDRYEDKK